jgi:tetratricopeptide (TPR) repeat protein
MLMGTNDWCHCCLIITKPVKLSFCSIVKNEAHNLDRCLASIKPYVDELIVVDTGSTDDTVAIAQRYGATVGHFEWCNDFAAARNYACTLATGDWILTLDADEELIILDLDWIAQLHDAASDNTKVFAIALRSNTASETQMQTLRLFQNFTGIQYCERYHEHLTYEGQTLPINHPIVRSLHGVEIIHYGYADDVIVQKSISRLPMLEAIRATDGLSLMLLWTLSGMYEATEASEKAQDCYEEAWDRLCPLLLTGDRPQDSRSVRSWLYALAVQSLQSEDIETSQFICQQGSEWFPDFPPLLYLNGLIYKLLSEPEQAIAYFEQCTTAGQTGHYFKGEPFDQALITLYPALELGSLYLSCEEIPKAIAALTLALSFDPNHAQAQEQLAIAHQRLHASQ